jgi:hypothetical protein
MRIANWRGGEIFKGVIEQAEANANKVLDEIVIGAKANLLSQMTKPQVTRNRGFGEAHVSFSVEKRGKTKDVEFYTDYRWMGRGAPNTLARTIRRVNRPGGKGPRVYAGNYKAYWAFMVEKSGYTDRNKVFHPPLNFLSKTFNATRRNIVKRIAKG